MDEEPRLRSRPGVYLTVPTPGRWALEAVCVDQTDLMYGPHQEMPKPRAVRVAKAKALCATCPVRPECASYALAAEEVHGVWGGLDEEDRARLRGHAPGSWRPGKSMGIRP